MIPTQPFRPGSVSGPPSAREKLLEAGVKLVRRQGFSGTSVDQLCREAGVTKGAFFHHFASKELLGVALADYWSSSTTAFFAAAPFHHLADPAQRVLGYIDLRMALIGGPAESFSCVAGTMVQEAFVSSDPIRAACNASIMGNAAALEADLAAAITQSGTSGVTAASLARHIQAVIQGAFVLAKAEGELGAADAAREHLLHLRRYFELLFGSAAKEHEPCPE